MKEELKRVSPESKGISSQRTRQLLQDLCSIGNEVHGFMLAVDGEVICEAFAKPYGPDIPHCCHSLGKSYTATAVGLAETLGYLSVEDRVIDIFAEEIREMGIELKPGMEKVRVRDLLSMSSGTKGMPAFDDNWFENFLSSEIVAEPGTTFLYNTTGASLLGAIAEKVTGKDMVSFLSENLFKYIGIEPCEIIWQKFVSGITAEPGLCATTEANLRLGIFYANGGRACGRQIISEKWMKEATSVQVENGPVHGKDNGSAGYGWQLWHNTTPGMFRFDGGQGQLCIIWPEKHCVAAIHQAGRDPQGCNRCIELIQHYMEEIGDAPLEENPQAAAGLKAAEHSLTIREPLRASVMTDAHKKLFGTYLITDGHFVPYIEVAPVDNDFWYMFHDRAANRFASTVELRPEEGGISLTVDGRRKFLCGTGGSWVCSRVNNVLPGLDRVCCCAEYLEDGSVRILIKWINGWSVSDITLKPGQRPGDLELTNVKDMLHEYCKPAVFSVKARKIKL